MNDFLNFENCTEILEDNLLPCPLCGTQPTIKVQSVEYGLSGTIIKCNQCKLSLYSPDKKAISVSKN